MIKPEVDQRLHTLVYLIKTRGSDLREVCDVAEEKRIMLSEQLDLPIWILGEIRKMDMVSYRAQYIRRLMGDEQA